MRFHMQQFYKRCSSYYKMRQFYYPNATVITKSKGILSDSHHLLFKFFFLRKRKETDSFKFRKIELILIRLWICWPALLIKNSTPNVQNGAYCHLICDYLTEVSLPIATITGLCEHSKDGFINHHFKILMEHPKL